MDTWEPDAKCALRVADILAWCKKTAEQGCDGITISGGEPFDQAQGLAALLAGLHAWRRERGEFDILCYSGYPLRTLEAKHGAILKLLDAVIPEPYIESAPPTAVWCGSANQRIVPLSERGRAVYADFVDYPVAAHGKQMQVAVDGGRVWMIGIPGRGDMDKLELLCEQRGLSMQQVSWRR
jgi:anaerobic ribonucleoside-triphosphate reductase activating protein